jgi:hypothetical protein
MRRVNRREALAGLGAAAAAGLIGVARAADVQPPLEEFSYEQVALRGEMQAAQRDNVLAVILGLDEDSLLKPFRAMSGRAAPGASLGGWYGWNPTYNYHHDTVGLAPGATFGQWTSALARFHAASRFDNTPGDAPLRDRALRLNALLSDAIAPGYFAQTRFPGYSLDKLVCGLMDAHRLLADPQAFATLDRVTTAALPSLPGHAVDREQQWKLGAGLDWMWDETYTLPENLYLVSAMGAGPRYRRMAQQYLDDASFFQPLARNQNVLGDKHAYSYVNALCSAMQAYFVDGSAMHLDAARNGFAFLQAQSWATGGWGPDESLRAPGYDELAKSLTLSHNSFETPCGSYAHMKLTRYLLRATRHGRYGDSMERVMLNTVLGALPLQRNGRAFYQQDCNVVGKRVYSEKLWPCCSGTLPQVVADYGINTYLHEPGAIWVNLYQPSELRWREGTTDIALEQTGTYLQDGQVLLRVRATRPVTFALRLRIPAWAGDGWYVTVNGSPAVPPMRKGFASLTRSWRDGDAVHLQLPMALRLETLPPNGGPEHKDTVALMRGPLLLFPLRETGETGPLTAASDALLKAEQTAPMEWTALLAGRTRRLLPFTAVGDREYSTYVRLI